MKKTLNPEAFWYLNSNKYRTYMVTSTDTVTFDRKDLYRFMEDYAQARLSDQGESKQVETKKDDWINASERMPEPEQLVFAAFVNEHGKGQIIRAIFAPRFTVEDDNDYEAAEYNEEKDEYFLKEGWYERNEFEQINWSVEAKVTHWKPLPKHPAS